MSSFSNSLPAFYFLFFTACASVSPVKPVPQWASRYYPQVRKELEPVWEANAAREIDKRVALGQDIHQFGGAENTVGLQFEITHDGKIENVSVLQTAKNNFLTNAAVDAVKSPRVVAIPPAECFREGHCQLRWDFVVHDR